MNFGELRFWGLLGGGLLVVWVIRRLTALLFRQLPPALDKLCLAGLGLFLLVCVSWVTFIIYLSVMASSYLGLSAIVRWGRGSPVWLWLLVPLQLAPLLYYKYGYFIGSGVLNLKVDFLKGIIIPVGISFYSFQKVAFAVDTLLLKKPIPRFLDYLNFAGFFPQIVAGPIERRDSLLPQMESFQFRYLPDQIDEGAGWVVLGLFFKCCLADNLAELFDGTSVDNPFLIWLANLVFGLRIYYDFAGYSLIAFGVAQAFGVMLTLNFESPYISASISEFWRRWHITLSRWFRDYLYIPLGGGRVRWWALNIAIVFFVSGVWHGAGWNFVIWGLLHGVLLIGNRLLSGHKIPGIITWALTMVAVFYSWLFFYETRPDVLVQKVHTTLSGSTYSAGMLRQFIQYCFTGNMKPLAAFLVIAFATLFLEWRSVRKGNEPYAFLRRPLLLAGMVVMIIWMAPGKANDFIYFAF